MNTNSSTATAADYSAGNLQDISSLARHAGLTFRVKMAAGPAKHYAIPEGKPVLDRLDLYYLVWADLNNPAEHVRRILGAGRPQNIVRQEF